MRISSIDDVRTWLGNTGLDLDEAETERVVDYLWLADDTPPVSTDWSRWLRARLPDAIAAEVVGAEDLVESLRSEAEPDEGETESA